MAYKFISKKYSGDATDTYHALEKIRAENGGKLETQEVVNEARKGNPALHDKFTWDDSIAGEKWRLQEARELIRAVVYVDENPKDTVHVFINVNENSEQYYQNITVATRSEFKNAKKQFLAKVNGLMASIEELNRHASNRKEKIFAHRAKESADQFLRSISI